jgi:hypothetical protein
MTSDENTYIHIKGQGSLFWDLWDCLAAIGERRLTTLTLIEAGLERTIQFYPEKIESWDEGKITVLGRGVSPADQGPNSKGVAFTIRVTDLKDFKIVPIEKQRDLRGLLFWRRSQPKK